MNRIIRLLCSITLLFAVTLSAGGMGHASGAHDSHMAAMSSVMAADASDHGQGDHASHDMQTPSGNHDGAEPADLMSCCAAMSGACAGFVAYLPTTTILQLALDAVPSYPLSDTYLSGVEPDCAQRPPRA